MTRKNSGQRGEYDADPDTGLGIFERLVRDVILFAVCCYLIRLGVCYLVSVRIPLIIIAAIIGSIVIIYRYRKWKNYHDDY